MAVISELLVGLGIDSDSYDKGIDAASAKSDNFINNITGKLGPAVAGAFAVGGAAVAAFAVDSVKHFSSFQASMNEVFTLLPGISADAMNDMTDHVKDFSKEFGVLPDKVVPALYQSLSAGVPPDNVFAFLEAANKASTAGVTDLSVAVDGISSVVNAYGSDVIDATKASDLMFTAVKLGKTNFEQLSSSLFNVTPTAAAANVKFEEVTAALAAMTLQGVPTSVATTQLRSAMVELSKDGTKVSDLFEKLSGKSFKEFEAGGGNMQQALQILEKHAKASGLGINDLFGSVEAGNAALALTGKGTDAFGNALAGMATSAGATDTAFATMNSGIQDAVDDMAAAFAVFQLDVGERLAPLAQLLADTLGTELPILTDTFLTFFDSVSLGIRNLVLVFQSSGFEGLFTVYEDGTSALTSFLERFGVVPEVAAKVSSAIHTVYDMVAPLFPLIERLGKLISDNWQPILAGVAGVLGVVVVGAVASAVAAVVSFAAPIIAAIAIGAAMYKAYTENFLGIQTVVNNVINAVSKVIQAVMSFVLAFWEKNGDDITTTANQTFNQVLSIISGIMNVISTLIGQILGGIAAFWNNHKTLIIATATALWNTVKGLFQAGLDIIQGVVKIVTGIINGDWQTFADGCAQVTKGLIDAVVVIFTDGWELVKGVFNTTIAAIDDLLSGFVTRALELGGNIINGIVNGVKNGASALADAVTQAASDAFNAAKDFLGIHSPSSLMYDEVGTPMIEGIANALLDGGNQLVDNLTGILGDALDAAQSALKKFQDIASFGINTAADTVAGAFGGGTTGVPGIGNFPGFADGVQNYSGGMAIVGENGPELLNLPRGSDVYPQDALNATTSGAPAQGVTQQFNIEAHYKTIQDELTLRDRIRLEGLLHVPSAG